MWYLWLATCSFYHLKGFLSPSTLYVIHLSLLNAKRKKKSGHQGCQNNIQSAFDKVLAIQLPAVSKSRILKALWEKKRINTDKRIITSVTYLHLSSYIFFKIIQNTISSHNPFVLRPYIPVVFNKNIMFLIFNFYYYYYYFW